MVCKPELFNELNRYEGGNDTASHSPSNSSACKRVAREKIRFDQRIIRVMCKQKKSGGTSARARGGKS